MLTRRGGEGLTRAERAARARKRRARAHLERVRGDRRNRAPRIPLRRSAAIGFGLALAAGLAVGASGMGAQPVRRVFVQGAQHVAASELAALCGLRPGLLPSQIDRAGLLQRLASNPWVDAARVLTLPNGSLLLGVHERQPAALLEAETTWVVDGEGVPFAAAPASGLPDLPRLRAEGKREPGRPDPDLAAAVALAARLRERGLPAPLRIEIAGPDDPEGLALRFPDRTPLFVLGREDLEAKLAPLARLLEAEDPELTRASRVDLRFRGQAVLDFEPSPTGTAQAAVSRGGATPSMTRPAG